MQLVFDSQIQFSSIVGVVFGDLWCHMLVYDIAWPLVIILVVTISKYMTSIESHRVTSIAQLSLSTQFYYHFIVNHEFISDRCNSVCQWCVVLRCDA